MKRIIALSLVMNLGICPLVQAEEVKSVNENTMVDDHHHGHSNKANFIPAKILNPDDSPYTAPAKTGEYIGDYSGVIEIEELDLELTVLLRIHEDGLVNLAYYFSNQSGEPGVRFYADEKGTIHECDPTYEDLVIMTAGLKENDNELSAGLIRKTISPVVMLDESGQADYLYPYLNLAYDLRENYENARVYQDIGLAIQENGELDVDVNHLIGLDSKTDYELELNKVEAESSDSLLVEKPTYQILQDSFDEFLVDYNDLKTDYKSLNDFLQGVLAMHLETNTSFSKDTTVEKIDPDLVKLPDNKKGEFAIIINDSILYAYSDGQILHSEDINKEGDIVTSEKWLVN